MRRLISLCLILLLLGSLGAYAYWCEQRPQVRYLSDLRSHLALNQGNPGTAGNLLGIQPELVSSDLQSLARLRLKLAAYLDQARDLGLLNPRTVVVLPEHIGTWLFAIGEKDELYQAPDHQRALQWSAARNPLDFIQALLWADGDARLPDALLRTKAKRMAHDYQQLFGGLARDYAVTLVAGSIVLPQPQLEHGQLQVAQGPLYNVSLVFDSAGQPLGQPHRQAFAAATASSQAPEALQVLDTPAGRLGILLGGDARHIASHARQDVELLVMPSDMDANTNMSEFGEHLQAQGIHAGLQVHMRGRLWERSGQATALAFVDGRLSQGDASAGAQLINLWL
ncbi:carbon-nitrogen hydrolase family protein [Pseudomonas sp. GOM7]|uniref:carbon-nitrogen hydrolase family protein n=1 Tax=unclassified Pseudomonas TaxID=196821 RepID=UPI00227A87D0|nr:MULTISPECIES: carbon-nitrogen hydrolase family protein [unclassified Pseudomonas]WAJ39106.1 carbon-nitrogen hydrolase family protein [Pseudomonas sp. GOM7]